MSVRKAWAKTKPMTKKEWAKIERRLRASSGASEEELRDLGRRALGEVERLRFVIIAAIAMLKVTEACRKFEAGVVFAGSELVDGAGLNARSLRSKQFSVFLGQAREELGLKEDDDAAN